MDHLPQTVNLPGGETEHERRRLEQERWEAECRERERLEQERRRKAEEHRRRLAEEAQVRQAEEERVRQAEQERQRKAEEAAKKVQKLVGAVILLAILALAVVLAVLIVKRYTHDWHAATCTSPKICADCGETRGDALGHSWRGATCTDPEICTVCGEIGTAALGHKWSGTACTDIATCTVCGQTNGFASGHSWMDATCTDPKTCTVCGQTDGSALGHSWMDATCTDPKTCTVCGQTEGTAQDHSWREATYEAPETCAFCGSTQGKSLGYSLTNCQVLDDSNEGSSTSDIWLGDWYDTFGTLHMDSLRFWVVYGPGWAEEEHIKYQVGGNFSELVLTMVAEENSRANTRGKFLVYSEDGLIYESEWITDSTSPICVTIDIRGCEQLLILCRTDSTEFYYGIFSAMLYN